MHAARMSKVERPLPVCIGCMLQPNILKERETVLCLSHVRSDSSGRWAWNMRYTSVFALQSSATDMNFHGTRGIAMSQHSVLHIKEDTCGNKQPFRGVLSFHFHGNTCLRAMCHMRYAVNEYMKDHLFELPSKIRIYD